MIVMGRDSPFLIVIISVEVILQAPFATLLAIAGIILYLGHIHTKKEIQLKSANEELLNEVVAQMEKDLAMTAIRHEFLNSEPIQLINSLAKVVSNADRDHRLADLLYRVDLKYEFKQKPDYMDLSEKLWNRVTQKVWFRNLYAKGETDIQ